MTEWFKDGNEMVFEKSPNTIGDDLPKPIPRSRKNASFSVTGTGCLSKPNPGLPNSYANIMAPIITGSGQEADLSLQQLSQNLNAIREEGFSKLSRLIRDLHSEKHVYKQSVDEIDKMIDERVHHIKMEIDEAHRQMKEKLQKMKETTSKKISCEIELCRKNVRAMNELVQTGLKAFDNEHNDYQLLFQLNLEILEKLNYMKSLKNSLQLTPPTYRCGSIDHYDVTEIIGLIEGGEFGDKKAKTNTSVTKSNIEEKEQNITVRETERTNAFNRSNRRTTHTRPLSKYYRQNSE